MERKNEREIQGEKIKFLKAQDVDQAYWKGHWNKLSMCINPLVPNN